MESAETTPFSDAPAYRPHKRRIALDGTDNFRDLGGYTTQDGHRIRQGRLFRSGHLGRLSDSDLIHLESLKIRKVVDFRGPLEKEQDRNRIPKGAVYVEHPVDVAGSDMQAEMAALLEGSGGTALEGYLLGVNRQFPREYAPVFAAWIQDLARNKEALPQVFHCTAGKDRTGFAAAILLRVLGVGRKTVMEDYLLSRELMADSIDRIVKHVKQRYPVPGIDRKIRPILGVHESYLTAAFNVIDEDWGDFDTFVSRGLNLSSTDIRTLKNLLLE